VDDALVFKASDVESVSAKAAFVCACLDVIRAEGEDYCGVPVPWRECLPKGILECQEPRVVEYLKAWERADARDEAYVRGGLVDVAPTGDVNKDAWERRAEAAGHRARCRMLGLSSEWSQSESSEEDSSSSSDDDE
jgi:hypothetical protein